ncbi:MAG: hypothetical protein ACRD5H_13730 [Nitrososphaerales archaeon]
MESMDKLVDAWSMNSRQPARYIKSKMGSQLTDTKLAHNGIIIEEAAKPKPRILYCGRCKEVNGTEKACSRCGYPLTVAAFEEIKRKEIAKENEISGMKEELQSANFICTSLNKYSFE